MDEKPGKTSRRWSAKVFCLAVLLLGAWLVAGAAGGWYYRDQFSRSWRTPKLDVPVVVIESDDWGLDYKPPRYVPPSKQLDASHAKGVERLTEVLRTHRDAAGRKPVVSAFIVVHQADSPAIAKDPQFAYHSRPIDQTMPQMVNALKKAEAEGVFSLVYHGRDHRDAGLWALKVKRAVEKARADGGRFDPNAVTQFHPDDNPREQDRIVAEYFDSREGYLKPLDQEVIDEKVATGLSDFERIFGRRPASTVAPRYLWGPRAESAWSRHGIRYVHGANKQGGNYRDAPDVWSRQFGTRLSGDLVGIGRNTDVEIAKDGTIPDVAEVLAWADKAVQAGQPIVICTHACNYCTVNPATGEAMARCLGQVLTELERKYPDLRYLSAEEAGKLAAEGKVTVAAGRSPTAEIRTAEGLGHVWLWLKGIYYERPKARLYAKGLALLVVLVAAAGIVRASAALGSARRKAS